MERRFRLEQYETTVSRVRGLLIAAILVIAGLGLQEVHVLASRGMHEMVQVSFNHRFFGAIPIYAVLLASTWLPGVPGRSSFILGLGIVAVIWSFALLRWHSVPYLAQQAIASMVLLDVVVTLVISVVALPLLFTAVVVMSTVSIGGIVALYGPTVWHDDPRLLGQFVGNALGLVSFAILLQWFRERCERRLFAQREHMTELNHELSRLNREKNEFMTIAAHDLRSPLSIVKNYAEMLQTSRMSEQDGDRAYAHIREQTDCMLSLVNNYLGAHAIETGAICVERKLIDLGSLVRRLQRSHSPRARSKSQSINFKPPSQPVWVESDETMLVQIIENFLGNALKFCPEGALINLHIEILVTDERSSTRLTVEDDGPGVLPTERDRLFRKFGRTSVRPTGGETNHGLGLAIVKELASRLNATVGFESTPTQGAAFWFEVPTAVAPTPSKEHTTPSEPALLATS